MTENVRDHLFDMLAVYDDESQTHVIKPNISKQKVNAALLQVKEYICDGGKYGDDVVAPLNDLIELTMPKNRGKTATAIDVELLQKIIDEHAQQFRPGTHPSTAANYVAGLYNARVGFSLQILPRRVIEFFEGGRITLGTIPLTAKRKKTMSVTKGNVTV